MADIQNDVNTEIARDVPVLVKLIFWALIAIVGASVLGYLIHAVTHP